MIFKFLKKNDYEILRIMVEKGTTNSMEISRELNISDKTIRNRMAIMKDLGIFKTAVVIDPNVFGYKFKIDFFLKVNKAYVREITDWLLEEHKHNIAYIGRHWGDDNISMQCVFKDSFDVEEFETILKNKEHINDFDMSIVPMIFKDTYDWRPHQSHFNITSKGMAELEERRQKQEGK